MWTRRGDAQRDEWRSCEVTRVHSHDKPEKILFALALFDIMQPPNLRISKRQWQSLGSLENDRPIRYAVMLNGREFIIALGHHIYKYNALTDQYILI